MTAAAPTAGPGPAAILIGERVRRARKAMALSQVQLGAAAGVSAGTIGNIEAGTFAPRPGTLTAIARALGVEPDDLTREEAPSGLVVDLGPAVLARVQALHATGMWGARIEDTVAELVRGALRREVAGG